MTAFACLSSSVAPSTLHRRCCPPPRHLPSQIVFASAANAVDAAVTRRIASNLEPVDDAPIYILWEIE
jgi:hypothetical protein